MAMSSERTKMTIWDNRVAGSICSIYCNDCGDKSIAMIVRMKMTTWCCAIGDGSIDHRLHRLPTFTARHHLTTHLVIWSSSLSYGHMVISGDTLLRDNRRLIGTSLIVLARQVQNNRD